MGVPAYLPSVFPSVTAAAEESDPVSENVIDLSKLVDYLNDTSALPEGVSVKHPENFNDIVEVTITQDGTYTLKGSNYIDGAYLDVKFIIKAEVTFNCDDVFIKNDNKFEIFRIDQAPRINNIVRIKVCVAAILYIT